MFTLTVSRLCFSICSKTSSRCCVFLRSYSRLFRIFRSRSSGAHISARDILRLTIPGVMLLFRRRYVDGDWSSPAPAGRRKLCFRDASARGVVRVFISTPLSLTPVFSSSPSSSSSSSLNHALYLSSFLLNVSMNSSTTFLVLKDLADLANIAPHVGSFAADVTAPLPSSKSNINLANSSKSIVPFPSTSISLNALLAIVADSSRSPAIIFHANANSSNSTSPPPSESSAENSSCNCALFESVSVRFTTFFLFASQSRVCELTHRNEGDGVFVVLFTTFLLAAFFLSAREEDKEEAQTSKSFRSKIASILRILAVILDDDDDDDDDDDEEETTTILFIFFAYFCDFL